MAVIEASRRLLLLCLALLLASSFARNVVVDVKSPWRRYSTSFSAELFEFISEQSHDLSWQYVDGLCARSSDVEDALESGSQDSGTDFQSLAFEVGSSIVPDSLHSLMDTLQALGAYAPAVKFFESLAEKYRDPCEGKAFAVAFPGNHILCSVSDLNAYVNANQHGDPVPPVRNDWDHVYKIPEGLKTPSVLVYLYGSIGTSSFCDLHSSLQQLASQGLTAYVMRHAFQGVAVLAQDMRIQGFGVFLDIKNMEYKTVDDKADSDTSGVAAALDVSEVGNCTSLYFTLHCDRVYEQLSP